MRKRKVDGAHDLGRSRRLIENWANALPFTQSFILSFYSTTGAFHSRGHPLQHKWNCTGHTYTDLSLGDAPSSSSSDRGTCHHGAWPQDKGQACSAWGVSGVRSEQAVSPFQGWVLLGFLLPCPLHRQVSPARISEFDRRKKTLPVLSLFRNNPPVSNRFWITYMPCCVPLHALSHSTFSPWTYHKLMWFLALFK